VVANLKIVLLTHEIKLIRQIQQELGFSTQDTITHLIRKGLEHWNDKEKIEPKEDQ
jgi:hypothetical protein